MTGLTWPDIRKTTHDLIRDKVYANQDVNVLYVLPYPLDENLPAVNTWVQRSEEGFIDRVTWIVVDVYTEPGESIRLAEQIITELVGQPHEVGEALLDSVEVEEPPVDVPRPDLVEQAQLILRITARPN